MVILQYRIEDATDKELEVISKFNKWLCAQIYTAFDTKLNRRKIRLRLNYLYNVPWIKWNGNVDVSVLEIMKAFYNSLTSTGRRNKTFVIHTDSSVLIPGTSTSIDRLIRFLEFGDQNTRAMGMLSKVEQKFDYQRLNTLWNLFVRGELGSMTQAKIITRLVR